MNGTQSALTADDPGRLRATEFRPASRQPCGGFRRLLVVAIFLPAVGIIVGCGSDDTASDTEAKAVADENSNTTEKSSGAAQATTPAREQKVSLLRVYTPEPGFKVLVDNRIVRGSDGEPLLTPCAVTLPQGDRLIRVVRDGYRDAVSLVTLPGTEEIDFEPAEDEQPDEFATVRLGAYWDLPVGQPVALDSINSTGDELDPYLSSDGLALWFAADRSEGRGIYLATRISPFHAFDEPRFIASSRNRSTPATPSVTGDGLSLVYAIPEEARIWSLSRDNPLSEFTDKSPLRFSKDVDVAWVSAQILDDGSRLYWVESRGGSMSTKAAVRARPGDDFGRTLDFPLAGTHPCVSHDGLRQFSFDGRALRRSQRPDLAAAFSEPQIVTSLNLTGYVTVPERRQFWVSEDEQWMVFCPNPLRNADLFLVRLLDEPNWGVALRGRSIPPREPAESVMHSDVPSNPGTQPQENTAQPNATPPTDGGSGSEPQPEPAELALSHYDGYRAWLTDLLATRDFDAAAQFVTRALGESRLEPQRELIEWDQQDVADAAAVWETFRQGLGMLKPGDPIRLGALKVDFVSFDGATIRGSRSGQEIERQMLELSASNVVDVVDRVIDRVDEPGQKRIGVFLFYDGSSNRRLAESRLKRGGDPGELFLDRQAERFVILAEQDLEAGRLAKALERIETVEQEYDRTNLLSRARELHANLYRFVKWETRGDREWLVDESTGEFQATRNRQNGSFLVSPTKLESFELRLEWKTEGRTAQGGIFFRYPGEGRPYDNSLKLHLANDSGVNPDMFCTGALFKLEAPDKNLARPEGEWNELILRAVGDRILVTINGEQVQDTEIPSSSFARSGHVVLDGEAGGITYRKILLLPLEDPAGNQPSESE